MLPKLPNKCLRCGADIWTEGWITKMICDHEGEIIGDGDICWVYCDDQCGWKEFLMDDAYRNARDIARRRRAFEEGMKAAERAFDLGSDATERKRLRSANPYQLGTEPHAAWDEGWAVMQDSDCNDHTHC